MYVSMYLSIHLFIQLPMNLSMDGWMDVSIYLDEKWLDYSDDESMSGILAAHKEAMVCMYPSIHPSTKLATYVSTYGWMDGCIYLSI